MSPMRKNRMDWIATTDKLPEDAERVLLFTPYPVLGDDHTCVGNGECISACTPCINRKRVPVFTHWMPLPPVPTKIA